MGKSSGLILLLLLLLIIIMIIIIIHRLKWYFFHCHVSFRRCFSPWPLCFFQAQATVKLPSNHRSALETPGRHRNQLVGKNRFDGWFVTPLHLHIICHIFVDLKTTGVFGARKPKTTQATSQIPRKFTFKYSIRWAPKWFLLSRGTTNLRTIQETPRTFYSSWSFQPVWKICLSNPIISYHFPNSSGWKKSAPSGFYLLWF